MSDPNETDLSALAETPEEAAAEAQQAELDAREAVGADLDDDGENVIAEEEGIS
ncbi:hypothetical protein [Tsukamurella paurometabola]|uniref:Uncharacterized protein n=1 Tax=Tsukamurella paurometabola TaxID=2061 RepID=A0A3P8KCT8_TSUPA|nr:hypothetical protein [Tsukamurella paurometabola]MBS4103110.1 hypothetical protein [Tsukamurella paurometabola]UEA84852.1 hypothetical protein LK411_08550 [Tsukamurella paurometabola]VDR37438.1 Uncharacterised protein [Tsukamurella paurometabola]